MTDSHGAILPAFTEHRVQHVGGSLYVRDFPGSGPAFVLLHGFPDNSYIYDHLIPHLAGAGRRTIAFDFLGFGGSDKPEGAVYTFEQQLGDLEAVAKALELENAQGRGTPWHGIHRPFRLQARRRDRCSSAPDLFEPGSAGQSARHVPRRRRRSA
jgi:hypothetical protein